MANKYRGKYPNQIASVWGTSTDRVYACETKAGARYFFSTRAMMAAGYKVSAGQLLGLDATALGFLLTSIAEAAAQQWAPAPTTSNS